MEKSPSKSGFLVKRKNDLEVQEIENGELKKIKVDDDASSSQQSDEDDMEDTTRENSPEQNLPEGAMIKNLFDDTLDIIRSKMDVENEDIEEAYDEIKEKFKGFQFNKIDFNRSENLIAYFYIYSAFNANLSRNRFIDAIQNCQQLQKSLKNQDLKVISLGGGPGTDMIGFLSALQDYFKQQKVENHCSSIRKLNITIVDMWKRWASFNNAIEFLIREGNYGNVSTIYTNKIISSSFIITDLLNQEQPKKYALELKMADIVLLVRVMDSFDFNITKPNDFIHEITSRMKSGALLLVIDSVTKNYTGSETTEIYASDLPPFKMQIDLKLFHQEAVYKESTCDIFILQKK